MDLHFKQNVILYIHKLCLHIKWFGYLCRINVYTMHVLVGDCVGSGRVVGIHTLNLKNFLRNNSSPVECTVYAAEQMRLHGNQGDVHCRSMLEDTSITEVSVYDPKIPATQRTTLTKVIYTYPCIKITTTCTCMSHQERTLHTIQGCV